MAGKKAKKTSPVGFMKKSAELQKQIDALKGVAKDRNEALRDTEKKIGNLVEQQVRLKHTLLTPEMLISFFRSLNGWVPNLRGNSQEIVMTFDKTPKEIQIVRNGDLHIPTDVRGGCSGISFHWGGPGFVDMDAAPERANKLIITVAYVFSAETLRALKKYGFTEIVKNIEKREITRLEENVAKVKATLKGEPHITDPELAGRKPSIQIY